MNPRPVSVLQACYGPSSRLMVHLHSLFRSSRVYAGDQWSNATLCGRTTMAEKVTGPVQTRFICRQCADIGGRFVVLDAFNIGCEELI